MQKERRRKRWNRYNFYDSETGEWSFFGNQLADCVWDVAVDIGAGAGSAAVGAAVSSFFAPPVGTVAGATVGVVVDVVANVCESAEAGGDSMHEYSFYTKSVYGDWQEKTMQFRAFLVKNNIFITGPVMIRWGEADEETKEADLTIYLPTHQRMQMPENDTFSAMTKFMNASDMNQITPPYHIIDRAGEYQFVTLKIGYMKRG